MASAPEPDPTPTPFTLHLLGTPRVEGPDGHPVELPLGKPLAALCYLALEPTGVRRTDLASCLWPASTEPRARASIRQALWLIRKHTVHEIVREEDGELLLDPSVVSTDLVLLRHDLSQGALERALERWDGGPLRSFTIPDAPPWLAWADEIRARWEIQLGQALEDRATTATGEDSVRWLEHATAVRPYRVNAWLALIQARVDLRDLEGAAEALAQLRQVADADDADRIREAEERLRLLRRSAYGDPDERLTPEFVGRSEEFAALMQAWRSAGTGRSRVIGILGPAGIGKTALAAEALRHADADDAESVEVRAVRTEATLELGVVGSIVAELLRRPGAAGTSSGSAQALRALVPSEGEVAGAIPGSAALADAVADLLDAVSHEAPVLLLVDDAQWMDGASALVLLRALRQLPRGARVLMVWTCRTEGEAARSSGAMALQNAAAQGSATLLKLEPLDEAEVWELVAMLLANPDPERGTRLATRLHLASAGSPLHLVELLRRMQDRGLVGLDAEGRWVLADDATEQVLDLPESLSETLGLRVEGLSDAARDLGSELARASGPLSPESLRINGGAVDPGRRGALSELMRRGLVRWTRDDRLELSHGELAEALLPKEEHEPDGTAIFGVPRQPFFAVAASVAVLLTAVAALWPRPAEPAPYGGGTIWLIASDTAHSLEIPAGREPWEWRDAIVIPASFSPSAGLTATGRPTGDPVLLGMATGDREVAPDAAMLVRGRIDTVFSSPGDDVLTALAPGGGAALVNIQDADTTRFRHMVARVDLASGDTAVLAAGEISYAGRGWSADGRWITFVANAAWDTVVVADPGGRRIGTLPGPDPSVVITAFCGRDRILVQTVPPRETARHWLWTPPSRLDSLRLRHLASGVPACSPDGSAVVYLARIDQRDMLVVEPFDGEEPRLLDVTARNPLRVSWTGPEIPVAATVEITAPGGVLARGERRRVGAVALDQTDRPIARHVEWRSDDPAVAAVERSGLLTANRPGRTTIRAFVDGWIQDSIDVTVTSEAVADRLAISDSFPGLDPEKWQPFGEPLPYTVLVDGRPALNLNGDGRYADGVASTNSFRLAAGATLEGTFWMDPFTREDRNRILLCLLDGDIGPDPTEPTTWTRRQSACVQWPAGEGVDFDPSGIILWGAQQAIGTIPIDTLLQPGRWNRLALHLRADGILSAVVGDSVVATNPIPIRNDSTVQWRVYVVGASVDNRLLLRDLTLWREEPVRAGPGG